MFTKSQDIELIRIVKKHPVLYRNLDHNFSAGAVKRAATWKKIGELLNQPAFKCKNRWLNMRDNMRKRLRERTSYPPSHRALIKYRYEDELAFLIPYFKGLTYNPDDFMEENVRNDVHDRVRNESLELENVDEIYLSDEEEEIEQKPYLPNFIFDMNMRNYKEENEAYHQENLNYNEDQSQNRTSLQENSDKDSIKVFLEAVDSTLRNLNPYYLNKAKSLIFQVAQDCEREQIVNKGEPS